MNAKEFAAQKGVSHSTVLGWLNQGLVPGATLTRSGEHLNVRCWDIPAAALEMKSPREVLDEEERRDRSGRMNAKEFAQRIGVSYGTVIDWLAEGLVPGATMTKTTRIRQWSIPQTALTMKSQRELIEGTRRTGLQPTERNFTAYHEAGRAVVKHLLCGGYEAVSIKLGFARQVEECANPRDAWRDVLIRMSGYIAESIKFKDDARELPGPDGDSAAAHAWRMVCQYSDSGLERAFWMREAERRLRQALGNHRVWGAVIDLANLLLQCTEIEAPEAEECIQCGLMRSAWRGGQRVNLSELYLAPPANWPGTKHTETIDN